ncbi:4-pyridoxate dehydrogenase-like [Eupeodes corollae]|uniref:4-pyridoxate dehydrogenase-like n=1 Tax=Eupeodes corollae TaxID=290404 RepID=UPI002490F393|nr:4-pyridoxate dehydrogenase-like [Eupeodes corollae]
MLKFREWFSVELLLLFISCLELGSSQSIEDILKLGQDAYNEERVKPVELPTENECFDFIIVGAGPAGCVLANRLSENPNWTVFLIEAGSTENIVHDIPALTSYLPLTESNWNYTSTPQKKACLGMNDKKCALPRGKLLGGSSGINFMIYNRGNRKDFDRMAEAGNFGWSYEEVLPYFKRSERANLEGLRDSPYHNTSGLQSVEYVKYRTQMAEAFVKASVDLGYPQTDYNGESQFGTSFVQATTQNGHRHSAAKAFVLPILNQRKNLRVLTFATVTKVLIDESLSAYGVNFVHQGKSYTIKARKEVILSAGTFNSPQLLMLSGVGPRDVLEAVGIQQLVDLPVGQTMYDHMSHIGPTFTTNSTGATLFVDRITPDDNARYQAGDPSTRLSSIGGVEALTFIRSQQSISSNDGDDRPDVELILASVSLASDYGTALKESGNFKDDIYTTGFKSLEGTEHFTIMVMPFHPKSTGRVWLADSNPFTPPLIDPNYFSNYKDIEVMLSGIKEGLRLAETPAMMSINATLFTNPVPGCENFEFGTDDYWRCSIQTLSYTLHHQVATCKMGSSSDPSAVVSPQLKVYGVRKLRVVDTSILPAPPTAHTNAASLMIGEKAADMIKSEWSEDHYVSGLFHEILFNFQK